MRNLRRLTQRLEEGSRTICEAAGAAPFGRPDVARGVLDGLLVDRLAALAAGAARGGLGRRLGRGVLGLGLGAGLAALVGRQRSDRDRHGRRARAAGAVA